METSGNSKVLAWIENAPKPITVYTNGRNAVGTTDYTLISADGEIILIKDSKLKLPSTIIQNKNGVIKFKGEDELDGWIEEE